MESYKKVLITPFLAGKMLECSKGNRNKSETKVNDYAESMKAGKWNYSNDAIVFDVNGVLRNGHHRLYAIIKANASIEMWVCYNAPEDAWLNFDTGKTRNVADMLVIENGKDVKKPRCFSSVARFLCAYEKNKNQFVNMLNIVSNEEVYYYGQNHIDEINNSIILENKRFESSSVFISFRILAIRKGYSKEYVDTFLEKISTGSNLEDGNPVLIFRNKLFTQLRNRSNTEKVALFFLLIKVFNYYKKGIKITKLYIPTDVIDIVEP